MCCFRNAPLALTKMLKALTNVFVHPAHPSIFQVVQNLYTCEVLYLIVLLFFRPLILCFFLIGMSSDGRSFESAGGVSEPVCPYKCVSDKYRLPNCYTPLEELVYTFGGPLPFALLLSCVVVVLGLLLSTLSSRLLILSFYGSSSIENQSSHCLPHLLSLSEVWCCGNFLVPNLPFLQDIKDPVFFNQTFWPIFLSF